MVMKKKNQGNTGLDSDKLRTLKTVNKKLTSMTDLPNEVVVDILAIAAGLSHTNLFNLKLSCKVFKDLAEEGRVYKHMSLENLPIIPWKNERMSIFLDRCFENDNSEALYRRGMVEIFRNGKIKTGLQHLRKAMDEGHLGASYLLGMVTVMIGEYETMMHGIQLLSRLCEIDKARECREKFYLLIKCVWHNYSIWSYGTKPPKLCTEQHWKKTGWSGEYEFFEDDSCKHCKCDAEIAMFLYRSR